MDNFISLYDFIDFARANKKYPENTANNLKSALKIFEKELNPEELKSINMVESSIGEIFRSLVIAHKDKSIISLNTYKARLLKVIKDYKKYGVEPSKIQSWVPRLRQGSGQEKTEESSPHAYRQAGAVRQTQQKDKVDKKKIILSNPINSPVDNCHKIDLSLDFGKAQILVPKVISAKEAKIIKDILDSLASE